MKDSTKRVLILDNDELVLIELERILEDAGFHTTITWDMREADQFLSTDAYDYLLLGDCFCGTEAERMLERAAAIGNAPRCLILAAPSRGAGVPVGSSAAVCKRHPEEVLRALSAAAGATRRRVSAHAA
jgi:DNA-binding response OmpR family regulator